MKIESVKKYLQSVECGPKELVFIKDFLQENSLSLESLCPEPENQKTWFLVRLLTVSLKDFQSNQDFIQTILSFQNESNRQFFKSVLQYDKNGINLLVKDSQHDASLFRTLLMGGRKKDILEYVRKNKADIKPEELYPYFHKISLIETLEKEGMIFDYRILPSLAHSDNFLSPAKLLDYSQKFKDTAPDEVWNAIVIKLSRFLTVKLYDYDARNTFKDTFCLITELKNPAQYQWGAEVRIMNRETDYFNFSRSLDKFLSPAKDSDCYIDKNNSLEKLKDFFHNNPVEFKELKNNENIFLTFINQWPDGFIEKTVQNNLAQIFEYENYKNSDIYGSRAIIRHNSLDKAVPLLDNILTRHAILKHYFTQSEFKVDNFYMAKILGKAGITQESIMSTAFIEEYRNSFTLEPVMEMAKVLKLDEQKTVKLKEQWLESTLTRREGETRKLKI